MRPTFRAFVAAVALGCGVGAAGGAETSSFARGRALFEKKCEDCHSLERAFDAQKDRAGWESVIRRMIAKGAKLEKAQIAPLLAYVGARSAFESRCNGCLGLDRPLAAIKDPEQWQQTVRRMTAKRPGLLTDADAEAVGQYLTLVTLAEPGASAPAEKR